MKVPTVLTNLSAKKKMLAMIVSLSLFVFTVAFVWPTIYRYDEISGNLIRTNRVTNNTQTFRGYSGWHDVARSNESSKNDPVFLSSEALTKLTGTASIEARGRIECDLYNGSDYKISAIYVRVILANDDEVQSVNRIYKLKTRYPSIEGGPFSNVHFDEDIGVYLKTQNFSWGIVKAKGVLVE